MLEPPWSEGAVQVTVADRSPRVATTPVGGPGTVEAGIAKASVDATEEPIPFTASTVK
jgi:hypothetical protein